MLNLFLDKGQPRQNALNSPLAETIKRQFDYTDMVLKAYHGRSAFRVNNNHVLVQALRSMTFRLEVPFEEVWANVNARIIAVARHYGFTMSNSFGSVHKNVFYGGKDFSEYLINHSMHDVEPFGSKDGWREKSPFNVLYHPVTDFHFLTPNGYNQPYTNNFSVVMVDLALLVFQYHMYRIEQFAKYGEEAILNPQVFLTREAIPRIFNSHFKYTIVNNVFSPGGYGDINEMRKIPWPPVSFPDFEPRIKPMTTSVHKSMQKSGSDYARILESIPLPYGKNALRALIMPRIPMTKQVAWVYWLARFRYILELLRLNGDRGVRSNKKHISALKTELGYFLNDKGPLSFRDINIRKEFEYFSGYVMNL